jgi:hypothetical protein
MRPGGVSAKKQNADGKTKRRGAKEEILFSAHRHLTSYCTHASQPRGRRRTHLPTPEPRSSTEPADGHQLVPYHEASTSSVVYLFPPFCEEKAQSHQSSWNVCASAERWLHGFSVWAAGRFRENLTSWKIRKWPQRASSDSVSSSGGPDSST